MPQGSKSAYTSKQKRKAQHIEESAKQRGASKKEAQRIGWATVNKQEGGGKKKGSGSGSKSGSKGSSSKRSTSSSSGSKKGGKKSS